MIVQVHEKFHDYEEQSYYIDTDKLKDDNPVDVLVKEAVGKKAFAQTVHVDVTEKRETEPDEESWEEPGLSGEAKTKLPKATKPEKVVKLSLYFDC